jgi:predicted chitinase
VSISVYTFLKPILQVLQPMSSQTILPLSEHPEYLEHLNWTMDNGNINSCARQSAFLAQTAQESAEHNLMVEQSTEAGQEMEKRVKTL